MLITTGLRSPAMNRTVAAVGAAVVLTATISAYAATNITTHPHHRTVGSAPASPLYQAIRDLQPYAYWPLNDPGPAGADASGNSRPALTTAGAGATVGFRSSSNPPGGSGGSVEIRPNGRQSGQYLRTIAQPVPFGSHGTVLVWFKLNRDLPSWWQTLLVDNGAATGYGAGFFVTNTGRLAYTDSAGTYDPLPGTFGVEKRTVSGPLNNGRWHMVAFVDQYTQAGTGDQWRPSLIYVDGRLADNTVVGLMVATFGRDRQSRMLLGAGQRDQISRMGRFSGNIADVALFGQLLTANQINAIWQAGT